MFLDSWDYTINHNENEDENRSHRHDINRPRLKHGHKNSKYRKYLIIMMVLCIKQHT